MEMTRMRTIILTSTASIRFYQYHIISTLIVAVFLAMEATTITTRMGRHTTIAAVDIPATLRPLARPRPSAPERLRRL